MRRLIIIFTNGRERTYSEKDGWSWHIGKSRLTLKNSQTGERHRLTYARIHSLNEYDE